MVFFAFLVGFFALDLPGFLTSFLAAVRAFKGAAFGTVFFAVLVAIFLAGLAVFFTADLIGLVMTTGSAGLTKRVSAPSISRQP